MRKPKHVRVVGLPKDAWWVVELRGKTKDPDSSAQVLSHPAQSTGRGYMWLDKHFEMQIQKSDWRRKISM